MKEPKFSVGQRIWNYNVNRRVYVDKDGNRTSAPVFTGHFKAATVVSVDDKHYGLRDEPTSYTFSRTRREVDREYMDDRGRDEMIWEEARYAISQVVREANIDDLKRAADLVGYRPDGLTEDMGA